MRRQKGNPLAVARRGVWLLWVVLAAVGCHKKVKIEFERPPAVASVPEPEPAEPDPTATEPSPPDTSPKPTQETPEKEEPPPVPAPKPRPAPPPEPVPSPEPPEPSLAQGDDSPESRSIMEKLTRAEGMLSTLRKRALTREQREQVAAAQAFVDQARKAHAERDYRRAAVLVDKGLLLAEDVLKSTPTRRQR